MYYNPRVEEENLGFMICFHRKYNLGDEHNEKHTNYTGWAHMGHQLAKRYNAAVILPLYLYDHSGLTISTTPFYDYWDSGQVGFILASRSSVAQWYMTTYCTKRLIAAAKERLLIEIEAYNNYLSGDDEDYDGNDTE